MARGEQRALQAVPKGMSDEPECYQLLRSRADVHDFVLRYAGRFHVDVRYA